MKASDAIAHARIRLNDTDEATYTDAELLEYLNEAINRTSTMMIAGKDPAMIVEADFSPGDPVPDTFASFIGSCPLYRRNGLFAALDGDETGTYTLRYYAMKPRLTGVDDDLPFADWAFPSLVNDMVSIALIRTGFYNDEEKARAEASIGTSLVVRRGGSIYDAGGTS
jgi:hypothetical protein